MLKRHILFYFLILFFASSQSLFSQTFEELENKLDTFEKDDKNALPYVKVYILKAKKEKDFYHTVAAYKLAVFYNADPYLKLKYTDSTIIAAKLSRDKNLIPNAYLGKGIIYYFNFKKYKEALNEYLKAYQYSQQSDDEYENHKIIYHIGVVKSYLGYYNEALDHFNKCISYFEPFTKNKKIHPNLIFNNKKGYLNSIHRAIVCYRNLKNFKKADSLIKIGLSQSANSKGFELEHAFFLKCRGVLDYHQKKYNTSITNLNLALPKIISEKEITWASLSYFYKGKSYLALGDKKKAVDNFIKVDSIFQKEKFILPELRENFELLISDAKKRNDTQKELYYTKSLLKADSIINKDFTYISSRIHKEYDTQNLLDTKNNLEHQKNWGYAVIILLIVLTSGLVLLLIRYNLNEKNIQRKYKRLETKLQNQKEKTKPEVKNEEPIKPVLNETIYQDILQKLEAFEANQDFREKGLTLSKLAKRFDSNSTYLSTVVNETKNQSFNKYLAELRIGYITQKLYYDKTFLRYTVEALADECGIASRQNFSDLFQEINGIRPKDFIKQRKIGDGEKGVKIKKPQ